jgi:hypothetical protein
VWITRPSRRHYARVVFDPCDTAPAHYNLWRGFSVQPDPGKSCEKFLAHIRDNICSGNSEHFLWVIGFLAHMVQKPEEKPGMSLVLRGAEGVGKGFFANTIGKLCLHHFVVISQATHLTGPCTPRRKRRPYSSKRRRAYRRTPSGGWRHWGAERCAIRRKTQPLPAGR